MRDSPRLLLGPLLRHVGTTTATVWVETDRPADVEVLGCRARTFSVCGHHYALVDVEGLEAGSITGYQVDLDGWQVWPPPGSPWPPSRIRTRGGPGPTRVVFGSCRRPRPDDPELAVRLSVDSLEAYAHRLVTLAPGAWPDALILLGDQIYADDPSPQTRRWLDSRRDTRIPPGHEVSDFAEYTHLYREAWSEQAVRWLLSTVPTAMIFDDHDMRDDWNTSAAWRRRVSGYSWWPARVRGALASYWIYQHIGNLSPQERGTDPIWCAVRGSAGDAWPVLRDMADAADSDPGTIRWSFRWDMNPVRLVMVDSRCGRILVEGYRAMLDEKEFRWVEDSVSETGVRHLLIGSSLPWLLPPAIHDVQAANELACARGRRLAERIRQALDLEHWAAFRNSFERFADLLRRVATGPGGPATITVLSGDVHHSYAARAHFAEAAPVHQLVCSPTRHRVPWIFTVLMRIGWSRLFATAVRGVVRRRGVDDPPLSWHRITGPFFGNAVSTLALTERDAELVIERVQRDGRLAAASRLELVPGVRR